MLQTFFAEAKASKETPAAAIMPGSAMMAGFNPMMAGPAGDMSFMPYMYPGLPGIIPGMPGVPFMQPGMFPGKSARTVVRLFFIL